MKKALALVLALALCFALGVPVGAMYETGKFGQVVTVSCGYEFCAVIKTDGSLWVWGTNINGLHGTGTKDGLSMDKPPEKVMEDVASVSCGHGFIAVIKTDGSLWMWGQNWVGQLGNGFEGNSDEYGLIQTVPIKVMDNVAAVSCGHSHAAAIKSDGSLWIWGLSNNGQLGNGSEGNLIRGSGYPSIQTVPVKVMDDVIAVSCGKHNTAAIKTDGSLWAWGLLEAGPNDSGLTMYPKKAMDDVISVNCVYTDYMAIKSDGSLWACGYNGGGRLGFGEQQYSTVPVKVMDDVAFIDLYDSRTFIVKTDGSLWFCGSVQGNREIFGEGNYQGWSHQNIPIKLMDNVAAAYCGNDYFVILRPDGSLWTFGSNERGMLGRPWDEETHNIPTKIMDGVAMPTITSNALPAPAVTVGGSAVAWTDAIPYIDGNGRTMVPMRAVADAMGLSVYWEEEIRGAVFTDGAKSLSFPIGAATAYGSDGAEITMDTAAVIENNRTYAPIRYLAEYFGHSVGWDGDTRTVIIT